MSTPDAHLVILFRLTPPGTSASKKPELKKHTETASVQYTRLLETLKNAGLNAVGRRGEELGHLAVFVRAPERLLGTLIYAERHADVLAGVPLVPTPPSPSELSPADRTRLIYTYITAVPQDGGLGIAKEFPQWSCIESITALHDRKYNELWLQEWTTHSVSVSKIDSLRKQLGTQTATYFSFLSWYTTFLHFPAVIGGFFFGMAKFTGHESYWNYHPVYSVCIVLWSLVWVSWWSAHETKLAIESGHSASNDIPKSALANAQLPITPLNTTRPRRATYHEDAQWYDRESRVFLVGAPVVVSFVVALAGILTSIFLLEAFVAQLYDGPGAHIFPLIPTILFTLLIPNFIKVSAGYLEAMTEKENHRSHDGWHSSMTLKVWALNATVAYLGLFLSAFVYIPFGDGVLGIFSSRMGLSKASGSNIAENIANATTAQAGNGQIKHVKLPGDLRSKLNPTRLQNQMFAYTVTNQGVNTFLEVGMPWVMKGVEILKSKVSGKRTDSSTNSHNPKKKVSFEDEQRADEGERNWLNLVREELQRPVYDVGTDYSEMIMQYGYVVLFGAVWPLASVMALLNNILELRSDAYKISTHHRRAIPTTRRQTIGPWLKSLEILTWLGASVNAALCWMFWAGWEVNADSKHDETTTHIAQALSGPVESRLDLISQALLPALVASHVYLVLRFLVKRVVTKAVLNNVKPRAVGGNEVGAWSDVVKSGGEEILGEFWQWDEGEMEVGRIRKEA